MATKESKQMETREDTWSGRPGACFQEPASRRVDGLRAWGGNVSGPCREAGLRRKESPVLMPVLFLPLFFLGSLLQAADAKTLVQEWKTVSQQIDNHKQWHCQDRPSESVLLSFQAFFQEQLGLSWNPDFKAILPVGTDWDGLQQAWFVLQRRYSSLRLHSYGVRNDISSLFHSAFSCFSDSFQEESEENTGDALLAAVASPRTFASLVPKILYCRTSGSYNIVYRLQNGVRECTLPGYPF